MKQERHGYQNLKKYKINLAHIDFACMASFNLF